MNLDIIRLEGLSATDKKTICLSIIMDILYLHNLYGLCYGKHSITYKDTSIEISHNSISCSLQETRYIKVKSSLNDMINDCIVVTTFCMRLFANVLDLDYCDLRDNDDELQYLFEKISDMYPQDVDFFEELKTSGNTGCLEKAEECLKKSVKCEKKSFVLSNIIPVKIPNPVIYKKKLKITNQDCIEILNICMEQNADISICETAMRIFDIVICRKLFSNVMEAAFISLFVTFRLYNVIFNMEQTNKHKECFTIFMNSGIILEILPIYERCKPISVYNVYDIIRNSSEISTIFKLSKERKDKFKSLEEKKKAEVIKLVRQRILNDIQPRKVANYLIANLQEEL